MKSYSKFKLSLFVFTLASLIVVASFIMTPTRVNVSEIATETEEIIKLAKSGNLDEAIDRALKALEMSPEQEQLQILLASTLLQKGSAQFDEKGSAARANVTSFALASAKPSSPLSYYLLGYAAEINENYKEAFNWYNTAISKNPSAAYLYSARGHAYDLDGQIEKAEADHRKALTINPSDIMALVNMARIELRRGNYDDAITYAKKAVDTDGNVYLKAEALLVQGYSAIQKGETEGAIALMSQAEALSPDSASILLGVAQAKFASIPTIKNLEDFKACTNTILQKAQRATQINKNHSLAFLVAARTFKLIGNQEATQNLYQFAASACEHDITLSRSEKVKICSEIINEQDLAIKS